MTEELEELLSTQDKQAAEHLATVSRCRKIAADHGASQEVLDEYDTVQRTVRDHYCREKYQLIEAYDKIAEGEEELTETLGRGPTRLLLWVVDGFFWLRYCLLPKHHWEAWKQRRHANKKVKQFCKEMAQKE